MTTAARCLLVALLSVATAWAGGIPGAVSPGEAVETTIEASCPAFSWAGVPGADSYEILVYRVPAWSAPPAAAPALQQHVPGEARSWTPPVNRCLERGGRYAWILRARAAGVPSEWSEPALFRVSPAPSIASVERALDTLRAFIESEGSGVAAGDPQLSSFASHVPRLLDSPQAVPSRSSSAPTPGSAFGPGEPFDELGLMAQAAAPGISASRAIGIYGYALGADGGAGVVGEAELDPLVGATGGDGVFGRSNHGSGVHGIGLWGVYGDGTSVGGHFDGPIALEAFGNTCCNGALPASYSVRLENTRSGPGDPDVLALGLSNKANPTHEMNYIGFFDYDPSTDLPRLVGEIEGDGSGAVVYKGAAVIFKPGAPAIACSEEGRVQYSSVLSELCVCDGFGWKPVDGSGSCT